MTMRFLAALLALLAGPAFAQPAPVASTLPALATAAEHVDSADEAIAADAAEYARQYDVPQDEAVRRLRAQAESAAVTDAIAQTYAARLAGIAIEHKPAFRIVVLLTGDEPVPDETIVAGGMAVSIVFRTGFLATRAAIDAAMRDHQAEIRAEFPQARGMGLDMRSGALVLLVEPGVAAGSAADQLRADVEALVQVPVRISPIDGLAANLSVEGGGRVTGLDPADGRRYACTTGFVVRYMAYSGIATAAHCPDQLSYADAGGARVPLGYAGQWGARYQDVQIGVAPGPLDPLFHAESKDVARAVTAARRRDGIRAGEFLCHRGEGTGYSCAEVGLVDYAPPGDLCAGPCDPVWISVEGPHCKGGDSGGPVFLGTTAFGIVKGETKSRGACAGYFFMSTDFLPTGWSLAIAPAVVPEVAPAASPP